MSFWTIFAVTWKRREQFKDDRKTIVTSEFQGNPSRAMIKYLFINHLVVRPSPRNSTKSGLTLAHIQVKKKLDSVYSVQLMDGHKRKPVHSNRLKPCFDQQKLIQAV